MSEKRQNEEKCLREVFEFAKRKKGITARIVKSLCGDLVNRHEEERPDFVLKTSPKSKHDKGRLIGIEHFVVDENSFKNKQGKIESTTRQNSAKIAKIRAKHNINEKSTSDEIDAAFRDVVSLACEKRRLQSYCGYNALTESFKYAFGQHAERAEAYRSELRQIDNDSSVKKELCFLIEIYSTLEGLLFFDNDKSIKFKEGYMPMFEDIVQEIENTQAKIDYIIFAFRTRDGALVDVLAVRKKYIRKDCDNQGARIYYYAGLDRLLSIEHPISKISRITHIITKVEKAYSIDYNIEMQKMDTVFFSKLLYNAIYCIYYAKRHGYSYATHPAVQACYEVISKYLIGWEKGTEDWECTPKCKFPEQSIWIKELFVVCKKYGVELPDDIFQNATT